MGYLGDFYTIPHLKSMEKAKKLKGADTDD